MINSGFVLYRYTDDTPGHDSCLFERHKNTLSQVMKNSYTNYRDGVEEKGVGMEILLLIQDFINGEGCIILLEIQC